MIKQVILVRDADNKTLASPMWIIDDANLATIQAEVVAYLTANPTHYTLYGQKWVDIS